MSHVLDCSNCCLSGLEIEDLGVLASDLGLEGETFVIANNDQVFCEGCWEDVNDGSPDAEQYYGGSESEREVALLPTHKE